MENITLIGETNFRNQKVKFGIKEDDRRRHIYIIGKTGMGKTTLLENLAISDIINDKGVAIVDPHGEYAERVLNFVPRHRINDVVFFNPADIAYPIAFNILEQVPKEFRHLVASGLMGIFKKIWPDVWSARMEYILNNAILALLEYPNSTLLAVNRMLANKDFRKKVVEKITDPVVKSFWTQEFAKYTQRLESEATAAIQNKIGQFISSPIIRNIIGQVKSTINVRKIMDEGKILIMNLSKGKIGEDNSRLLGAMLITKIQIAAMSRVDTPEKDRRDFYLYVDEFQNFATSSFVNILSEARKYRLSLTLAHQYIDQMEESVRDAIFGNVGTIICFRVGAKDAEFLEKEFSPEFTANDLVNLGFANIYLKLMIDGVASRPFSARTLPPYPQSENVYTDTIIRISRERYTTPQVEIEEKIQRWMNEDSEKETKEKEIEKEKEESKREQRLYDAICSNCGAPTKTIFEPDGIRPVYCKKCLKIKKERDSKKMVAAQKKVTESQKKQPLFSEEYKVISANKPSISLKSLTTDRIQQFHHKKGKVQPNLDDVKKSLKDFLSDKNDNEK